MVSSVYLGLSPLSCGTVPGCVHYSYKKHWFGQKGSIIDGTLICFNLYMDVTLPVYTGPGLLHNKRVSGVWVCMYKKGQVDWKGLTILNNQISFLSNRSKFSTLLPNCPCLSTLDPVS